MSSSSGISVLVFHQRKHNQNHTKAFVAKEQNYATRIHNGGCEKQQAEKDQIDERQPSHWFGDVGTSMVADNVAF